MVIEDFNNALSMIVVIDTKNLLLSVAEVERLGEEALDRLDRIDGRITSINNASLETLGMVQDIGKDLSLLNLYQDGKPYAFYGRSSQNNIFQLPFRRKSSTGCQQSIPRRTITHHGKLTNHGLDLGSSTPLNI